VNERGREDAVSAPPLDVCRPPATTQAAQSGQIVVVSDLDDPRLSSREKAEMAASGLRSVAYVPFSWQGHVRGLICVFDRRPRDYAEQREYLLAAGRLAAGVPAAHRS